MNKLLDEFNINKSLVKDKADYDTFKDKDLLDDLRVKILENLSDNDLNNSFISSDLISSLIDEETYNTSLSLEERKKYSELSKKKKKLKAIVMSEYNDTEQENLNSDSLLKE